jgi:hypothetical protein
MVGYALRPLGVGDHPVQGRVQGSRIAVVPGCRPGEYPAAVADNAGIRLRDFAMPSVQVLKIKVLNCGGMMDLMSEQEASFLVNSLGLFRNQERLGRATPRANVNLVRAYNATDFYRSVTGDADILHLIAHGDATTLQTGNGQSKVTSDEVERKGLKSALVLPAIVVSTVCKFQSVGWRRALKAAGVEVLIAAQQIVTPANLTAFDMAFYSALLSQVRRGMTTTERVERSFTLANRHYKEIHAAGTPFAKFSINKL